MTLGWTRLRLALRFLALGGLIAWVLLAPLRSFGQAYGQALRTTADVALQGVGTNFHVRVKSHAGAHGLDSAVVVKPAGRRATRRPFRSRQTGYLPTICGLALVLATPIPWRRRLRAALLATLLIQVFVAGRVGLLVLQMLLENPRLHGELPGFLVAPGTHNLITRMTTLDHEASLFFLVPLAIWAAVTLRMEDIDRLWLRPPGSPLAEPPEPADRAE